MTSKFRIHLRSRRSARAACLASFAVALGMGGCAPKATLSGRVVEGLASIAVLVPSDDARLKAEGFEAAEVELRFKGGLIGRTESVEGGSFELIYDPNSMPTDPIEIVARREGYAPARTTVFPPKPGQAMLVQLKRIGPVPPSSEETPARRTP